MPPLGLFRRIARLFESFRACSGDGYLLDAAGFHAAMLAERMRSDRNNSQFSLLLIRLPGEKSTSIDYKYISRLLEKRLRLSDSSGIWVDGRIGALLPDTPASGAWKVAEDICEAYPVGHSRPDCEVVIYPEHSRRDSGDNPKQGRKPEKVPTASDCALEMDILLATSTPLWKRTVDILGSTCGLILATPIILLAGAAIKLSSPGPVFYSQEREGLGGQRFRIWKLRTMRPNADVEKDSLRPYSEQDGPAFKMMCDPRITRVGRFLRRFSLDELPQLWNVLRGEMSLVGPRPLPVDESHNCKTWQRRRLHITPGLTCIWQIKGRNVVPFEEWIRMDLYYAKRRSLWYDLKLLFQTPMSLIFAKGPR